MTNFEYYSSSIDKMAFALAVAEDGANDYPNSIEKWKEWLQKDHNYCYFSDTDFMNKYMVDHNKETESINLVKKEDGE